MDRPRTPKVTITLYDHLGRPMKEAPPTPLSATWMRRPHYLGPCRVGRYDEHGQEGPLIRERLIRAQIPYIVTLLVYHSKFDIQPTAREYFVYAPMEIQKAAEVAVRLWQRWERPPRDEFLLGDMREVFPKIEDGIVAEPIGDSDFDSHWKDVLRRKHKAAGDPLDPFAFTCLDQDVRLFKHTDFQSGLAVTI